MREITSTGVVEMGRLEAEFPGWRLWISDTGRWWAFRTSACALTIEQLRAGCRLIVQADTSDALYSAIRAAEIEAERATGQRVS
ncbi:hypothetical protein GCM10027176_03870 [Actinoallomurus bryophytorum]|uniref:Uncharacterized protein n=1 Tax=Actinoallomurus bryophytorum TaxID=1490222 RepID=A0A543CJQ5_9ACTN|nr:hypothetical protein [Actinoallomurus bryophytorum]TQL97342.1 hypothetical protein FB559_2921 [Actinoallomurus bryophytorum]